MKYLITFAILGVFAFSSFEAVATTSENQEVANRLLKLMNPPGSFEMIVEQMISAQKEMLQQRNVPCSDEIIGAVSKFHKETLIKDQDMIIAALAKLYAKAFSVEEMNDLIRFYESPTGQKSLKVMPQLAGASTKITSALLSRHANKLGALMKGVSQQCEAVKKNANPG
jgi:hypothetical protein